MAKKKVAKKKTTKKTAKRIVKVKDIEVLYINNHGGGYADYIKVPGKTKVDAFFRKKMPGANPVNYLIRINRVEVPSTQVLKNGDRISITPTKIAGS